MNFSVKLNISSSIIVTSPMRLPLRVSIPSHPPNYPLTNNKHSRTF